MSALDQRVDQLTAKRDDLERKVAAMRRILFIAEVELARCQLLQVAEANPSIAEFVLDAEFSYDDEGGFYYGACIYAWDAEGELIDPLDPDVHVEDPLVEIAHWIGEEEAAEIFGNRMDGRITVVQLREEADSSWSSSLSGIPEPL